MKRYSEDDLPIVKKMDCLVCGRQGGRASTKALVRDGWLSTTHGMVCPSGPEEE